MLLVCHAISQEHMRAKSEVTYDWKVLMANHQLAKFGSRRYCGSGDIMILGCHMISQDHVIEESCYFMGRSYQDKPPSSQGWES